MVEKTSELKQKHQAAVAGLLQRYTQLRSEVANYNKALEMVMMKEQQPGAAGKPRLAADVGVSRDQ